MPRNLLADDDTTWSTTMSSGGELDALWLMFGAMFVFFMQTGFAMLSAGIVSPKNTQNILLKNVMDASIGAICWYLLGYGLAFGDGRDGAPSFIGTNHFALQGDYFNDGTGYAYAFWLFQWAFAATAATIVSGAVAERCAFSAYMAYAVCLTSFVYPVVAHGAWNATGWASAWRDKDLLFGCGVLDFAGSGVVHMTGGVAAFWAVFFLGPRRLRFPKLPGYAFVFQTLGTLILWFGWYGFNGASTLLIVGYGEVAARVMVCTTIAAGAGAVFTMYGSALYDKYIAETDEHITVRLGNACNGALAGLVSITSSCAVVEPYGALCIGAFGGLVYFLCSKHLHRIRSYGVDGKFGTGTIDDVIDAIPVHGGCGIFGVLMAGFFATQSNYAEAYYGDRAQHCAGVFYGGSGKQLAANVVFILANFAWTSCCSVAVFGSLRCVGRIRVTELVENIGMDISEHGAHKDGDDHGTIADHHSGVNGDGPNFHIKVEGTAAPGVPPAAD